MRKRRAVKRDVLADPIYNSKVVTKLINQIMQDGKKGTAQKILYGAFDMIQAKMKKEPLSVFNEVIDGSVTVLLEPNLYVPSYQDARFYLNTGLYYDDIHGGADLKIGDFIWEVSIGNISVSDYAKYMTKELCAVLNKPIKDGYNSLYLSLN